MQYLAKPSTDLLRLPEVGSELQYVEVMYPADQVVSSCVQAGKWLKSGLAGSIGSFTQQLRLVHTLQQLLAFATAVAAGSAPHAVQLAKLRGAALHPRPFLLPRAFPAMAAGTGRLWRGVPGCRPSLHVS